MCVLSPSRAFLLAPFALQFNFFFSIALDSIFHFWPKTTTTAAAAADRRKDTHRGRVQPLAAVPRAVPQCGVLLRTNFTINLQNGFSSCFGRVLASANFTFHAVGIFSILYRRRRVMRCFRGSLTLAERGQKWVADGISILFFRCSRERASVFVCDFLFASFSDVCFSKQKVGIFCGNFFEREEGFCEEKNDLRVLIQRNGFVCIHSISFAYFGFL